MIARRGGALALVCLISAFVAGCGENPSPTPAIVAPAVSPDQLVGKWGFAAYHKDEDRARTIKEASAQCNRPYVIAKGPTGGVMMNLADQKELSELFLKPGPNGQTYLGPAGAARPRRPHRLQCRCELVHDGLGRSRQCKSLWHVSLRAVRKALISDPIWDLTLFLQSTEPA